MTETFDTCHYANGTPYVVTDHGPNVWVKCPQCGEDAACTPDRPAASVRCGECLRRQFELLPGQRIYNMKAEYAREHRVPRWVRKNPT